MSVKTNHERGFTLVELLVALLVASFLLIILFDGIANATERSSRQDKQQLALILAQEKLKPSNINNKGSLNELDWIINEEILARGPRSSQVLIRRTITISDKNNSKLISLTKRYLKSVR